MIGIDTNLLIRLFTQDHEEQADKVAALMETLTRGNPGFVSTAVLVETYWVLSYTYKFPRQDVSRCLAGILASAELVVENRRAVIRALATFDNGKTVGFTDCLIAETARQHGATQTYTFDRAAAREADMTLLS